MVQGYYSSKVSLHFFLLGSCDPASGLYTLDDISVADYDFAQ